MHSKFTIVIPRSGLLCAAFYLSYNPTSDAVENLLAGSNETIKPTKSGRLIPARIVIVAVTLRVLSESVISLNAQVTYLISNKRMSLAGSHAVFLFFISARLADFLSRMKRAPASTSAEWRPLLAGPTLVLLNRRQHGG
ncbi:hypothetical protein [Mixta calida]|uniref:hypothetical protein n=1 Tax=Mixta calida TaxID=665913 RepID=UPI00403AF3B7